MRLTLNYVRSQVQQTISHVMASGNDHFEDTLSKVHTVLVEAAHDVDRQMGQLYGGNPPLDGLVERLRAEKEKLDLFHDDLRGRSAVLASKAVAALEKAIYALERLEIE